MGTSSSCLDSWPHTVCRKGLLVDVVLVMRLQEVSKDGGDVTGVITSDFPYKTWDSIGEEVD